MRTATGGHFGSVTGRVLGVTALLAMTACGSGSGPGAASPGPSTGATGKAPPLVRARDAVDATAGHQLDVVATLRGADADRAVAVAPDGAVLLATFAADDFAHRQGAFSLLDPSTGHRTSVDVAPGPVAVDAVTSDSVVTSSLVGGRLVVVWFDRATGSSSRRVLATVPSLPGARPLPDVAVGPDRTVWFLTHVNRGEGGGSTRTQLWEAAAGAEPHLVARVTDVAVAGQALAWTDREERASGTVHVRNLADGTTSSFELPGCTAGSKSAPLGSVRGAGDLLALQAICPHAPHDRTFVARTDGTLVADLVIGEEAEPTSLGARAVAYPQFVFDVAQHRLLRLDASRYEHAPWPQTAGDLVAWRLGSGTRAGPLRIARLR